MPTVAQCLEELKEYPQTLEEAISTSKYRKMFREVPDFKQAPSEKIKMGVINKSEVEYFAFWYSRKVKQYFLFTNAPGHYGYLGNSSCVMKLHVICGDQLIFLKKQNIIVDGPVYSSPGSPWRSFRHVMMEMGKGYNQYESLDTAWESFYSSLVEETSD